LTLGTAPADGSRVVADLRARAQRLVRAGHVTPVEGPDGRAVWVEHEPDEPDRSREPDRSDATADPDVDRWYRSHLDALAASAYGPARVVLAARTPELAAGKRRVRRALTLWGDQVAARRAAGMRLAVRISAPATVRGRWDVEACLVALTDPAVVARVPDVIGDPRLGRRRRLELERLLQAELARAGGALWHNWDPTRPLQIEATAVADYLDRHASALADLAIATIAPAELLTKASVRRRAVGGTSSGMGLGTAAQLALTGKVEIAGEPVSAAELQAAIDAHRDLLLVGDRWVHVGAGEIAAALAFLRRVEGPVTAADVLVGDLFVDVDLELGADAPAWMSNARSGDWAPSDLRETAVPEAITATLRPYQHVGLNWLSWCEANDLGGILADDMGLGKTLQILAAVAADHAAPTLVVCPPSIVTNWIREAHKFAPALVVRAFHGASRGHLAEVVDGSDIVVTTYDLVRNDAEEFAAIDWLRVVLDEAGKIKNPMTKTAAAVRRLVARQRFAVTGTPVENHAGELWSLMQFANPGLLGPYAVFMGRFNNAALSAGDDGDERAGRLAEAVAPFVLRRLKTEPGVADELPPKTVVRDDCALTTEQIAAYEVEAAAMLEKVERSGRDQRRIAVIVGIARLKQICNHPAALIDDPVASLAGRSGKVDRLTELLEEIVDEGSAAVVFSQYPTFMTRIAAHLDRRLGLTSDVLSGKVTRARRDAMVDRFCDPDGPPVLYSSLKAGGIGLNLTRANHIIHFDMWWNPAAEDQASDRAWRIGQTRPVIVHNLVCPGTLEERIETMLEMKRTIAAKIVGTSEAGSLAQLDDDALAALVQLSRSDLIRS
jgi:hypothetical protein